MHRDLKPANIFLAQVDDEEVLKVLDFGVAKWAAGDDGDATATGVVIGSPNYMSPEQARSGRSVDRRSDIWSMGVILFRCLVGRAPFRGNTTTDVIVKICAERIPLATELAPDLPPAVDEFFARCLVRDCDARFDTVDEMYAAFRELEEIAAADPAEPAFRASLTSIADSGFGSQPMHEDPAEATTIASGSHGTLTGVGGDSQPGPRRSLGVPAMVVTAALVAGAAGWTLSSRNAAPPSTPATVAAPTTPKTAREPDAPAVSAPTSTVEPSATSTVATPSTTATVSASATAPPPPAPISTVPRRPARVAPPPPATPALEKPAWGF